MKLLHKTNNKTAKVGIIGLGYVGLPIGLAFASKGFEVLGFDLDENKITLLKESKGFFEAY